MGIKLGPDGLGNTGNNLGELWIDFDPTWFIENLSEGPFFRDLSFISGQIIQDIFDYKRGIEFLNAPSLVFETRLFGKNLDVKEQVAIPNDRNIEEKLRIDNEGRRKNSQPATFDDYCHIYDDDDFDLPWTGEYAPLNHMGGGERWNHLRQMELDGFVHSTPITKSPLSPGEHLRYDGEVCSEKEWIQNLGVMDVYLKLRKLSWVEESVENKFVCVNYMSFAMGCWPEVFFPILMESIGLQRSSLNLDLDEFGNVLRDRFRGIQLDTTNYKRID